jgi:hypothetical protein
MPRAHRQPDLEGLVDRALRTLPARRAPQRLAARVQAELARRAALPWWRRGVAAWPAPARVAFGAICVALVSLSVIGGARLLAVAQPLAQAAQLPLGRLAPPWAGLLGALWNAAGDVAGALASAVPRSWLGAGALLALVTYGVLLALAAITWRALQARR